jgi:hypothetical protein
LIRRTGPSGVTVDRACDVVQHLNRRTWPSGVTVDRVCDVV